MDPKFDVAEFVGAASAPVALIIATSIFLSNLGTKYGMLGTVFRQISTEFREHDEPESLRNRTLHEQLSLHAKRLRLLMRASFWLGIAIICFIATVVFTGVSMVFPEVMAFVILTTVFSFAGAGILATTVVMELVENHCAQKALILETAEFPGVLWDKAEKAKHGLREEHEQGQDQNDGRQRQTVS